MEKIASERTFFAYCVSYSLYTQYATQYTHLFIEYYTEYKVSMIRNTQKKVRSDVWLYRC